MPEERGRVGGVTDPVTLVDEEAGHGREELVVGILLAGARREVRGVGVDLIGRGGWLLVLGIPWG